MNRFCLGLGICLTLTIGVASMIAQDYEVLKIAPQFDLEQIKTEPEANGDAKKAASIQRARKSKQNSNASKIFRDGGVNDSFRAYYQQVIVPELTLYDDESLKKLAKAHQDLIKELNSRVRNNGVRGVLITEIYFPMFKQIVEGNFHPAVRYNALLSIGKLDEVVGKQRVSPPRPYREVLPFLIAKYNEFKDPQTAYLKYGAFRGIARIASIGFQQTPPVYGEARPLLTALMGPKPDSLPQDLYLAMQRQAVTALGYLGDPINADSFAILLQNKKLPLWTRAEAALAISRIKGDSFDPTKLDEIGTSMAQFMHDVLRDEVNSLTENQKRIAVLAARRALVGAEPVSGGAGPAGSGKSSGSSADDRAGGLMGSGGGSGSMMPGSGSGSGGSGSMMPGSGSGAGSGSSGSSRSGSRAGNSNPLEDLPAYRLMLARRRVKTIARSLLDSYGTTSGATGILRWAKGATLQKLSELKKQIGEADTATELGLDPESSVQGDLTDAMKQEFTRVANSLAISLGMKPAAKDTAADDGNKKADNTGDAFLNNN